MQSSPDTLLETGRSVLRERPVSQNFLFGFENSAVVHPSRLFAYCKANLSEHTIKNYLFRVFEKLGVSSRFELLFLLFNAL
jgi:hypothetical protein